ncbi:MAG: porin family protein [Myxococcales bacterium]
MKKMVTILTALTAFFICLAMAAPAFSQEYDYARNGGYAGISVIGGSYARFDDELEDQLLSIGYIVNSDTDEAAGFKLYGGYRLGAHFAIEAEFEMLPKADIDIDGFGKLAELQTWVLTGNAKVFPLTGRIQPYALFGLGVMEADLEDSVGLGLNVTETDFAVRFGGGVDFYITANIVASTGIDYVLPTGDVQDIDYVSFGAGIQYRF